jgi:hypothetical protein
MRVLYWPDAPALWFSRAECSFLLRNVTEQREKFCLVVQSLPRDSMRLVADLVETPPAELMYVQRPEGAAAALSPAH